MSKITYMTKTLVVVDIDEDDTYIHIDTNHWSNLLEAALKNDLEEVKSLMDEATNDEIKNALSTLKKAFKICKQYKEPIYEYVGWMNGEHYDIYRSEIKLEELTKARTNLLWHLKDSSYLNITLSEPDQRLIENRLLEDIKSLTSLQKCIDLYKKYENSPKLNHYRNPNFDAVRSALFQKRYSSLKINFIEALKIKAWKILMNTDSLQSLKNEIDEAANTIFLKNHQIHGVSGLLNKEFVTQYLNQVSSKFDLEI